MHTDLMKDIATVARCSSLYRSRLLEETGISGYQASYIPEICADPGLTQDRLAQILHVTPSSVTRQLAMLEENGYITRKRSASDKRAVQVFPTEKCDKVLPLIRESFVSWRSSLTECLTSHELDTLSTMMRKLAERAKEIE